MFKRLVIYLLQQPTDQTITMQQKEDLINWDDFSKIEMRVGTVLHAEVFEKAIRPAYKITIDFGDFGIRKTSAQITKLYEPAEIIGKQVVAVVNFPAKQIANFQSQCLLLGTLGDEGVVLLTTERKVENGLRIS